MNLVCMIIEWKIDEYLIWMNVPAIGFSLMNNGCKIGVVGMVWWRSGNLRAGNGVKREWRFLRITIVVQSQIQYSIFFCYLKTMSQVLFCSFHFSLVHHSYFSLLSHFLFQIFHLGYHQQIFHPTLQNLLSCIILMFC